MAGGVLQVELGADRLDESGEERHGGDDRRADGEALRHGLGGVADGVEADHDPLRRAFELARHLGDAGRVVGHRAEGVLGDDDAGGGQHAHTAQRHQVEGELQVAAAEGDGDPESDGDGDDGVDGGFEPRRDARQHGGGRPGAGRLGDLPDGGVLRAGEVLGQPAHDLGQHEADDDGGEHLPALVVVVVLDVGQGDDAGPDDGQDAGGQEAPVDGLEGVGLVLPGLHGEDPDDRGQHADGPAGDREDEAQGGVGADRTERRHPEDDRGDQGHLVGLEEVGGHTGTVAHVVAHVVGDGGRVAGVILGDAGLDLADEVGADVGRLGEDAAADPQEQGEQRATEAEPDQDG